MILLLLACTGQNPSALDKQFCEARCKAAGASDTLQNRAYYMPTAATRTEIINGDILCTCYFPQGAVR